MSERAIEIYTGDDAGQVARRKSRYGRHDWVWWTSKDGQRHCARVSYDALKTAMLAVGTQGKILMYSANTGTPLGGNWSIYTIWLANLKAGYYVG